MKNIHENKKIPCQNVSRDITCELWLKEHVRMCPETCNLWVMAEIACQNVSRDMQLVSYGWKSMSECVQRHATCELWLKEHIEIQCRSHYGPPHPFEDSGLVADPFAINRNCTQGLWGLHEWTSKTLWRPLRLLVAHHGSHVHTVALTACPLCIIQELQADRPSKRVTRIACRVIVAELLLVIRMDYVLLRPPVLVVSLWNFSHPQRTVRNTVPLALR
jgi:hypothetical protein